MAGLPCVHDGAGPLLAGPARLWHFFFAWLLVLNGLLYLAHGFISRHLQRDMMPTRADWRGIGGCDKLGGNETFAGVLSAGESLSRSVRDAISSSHLAMSQGFSKADLSPTFRGNGNAEVANHAHIGDGKGGYWEDQGYQWYAGI